jgi:hypothetical protein
MYPKDIAAHYIYDHPSKHSDRLARLVDGHADLAHVRDRALDALVGGVEVLDCCLRRRRLRRCRALVGEGEFREVVVLGLLGKDIIEPFEILWGVM